MRILLWVGLLGLAGCGPVSVDSTSGDDDDADNQAPTFAGLTAATGEDPATARLQWDAATDDSGGAIAYDVYHATASGAHDFTTALLSVTDRLEARVESLDTTPGVEHVFVVRARDQAGNQDKNAVERAVRFAGGIGDAVLVGRYQTGQAADVAANANGDLVALSGWQTGDVWLLDTTDKTNPVLLSTINNVGYNTDVQIKGDILYVNHENVGHGIDIFDIADPTNPVLRREVGPPAYPNALRDCHNLWPQPDRQLLYCASTQTGELAILSTGEQGGTPDNPAFLTSLGVNGQFGIHDMYALGNRLYVGWLDAGLGIYDITDPSAPVELAVRGYNNAFCHNAWPVASAEYVLTTDEQSGGHIRVWDVRDLGSISQIARYQPNPNAIVHNIEIVDDIGFISHYSEGLKVIDLADPTAPVELAGYDIFNGADGNFEGAWGVEPVMPWVFVSGIESGLWIFELVP